MKSGMGGSMKGGMKASIEWLEAASFQAEAGSGHRLRLDGPPEAGGRNAGMRPMEALLIGMGGCAAFDVKMILDKARQAVTACTAELTAERADAVPAVFTRIHAHFIVQGRQLSERQVQRAIALSAEKYCSASIMLAKGGVQITHSHEIQEAQEQEQGQEASR